MSGVEVLNPLGNDFDRFLYASIGEDKSGSAVTVVSALARLGLDPWKEAAELAALGQEAAHTRLGTLLSDFGDVPTLLVEHDAVATELTALLPQHSRNRAKKQAVPMVSTARPISYGWIFAAVIVVFVLVRFYFLAQSG